MPILPTRDPPRMTSSASLVPGSRQLIPNRGEWLLLVFVGSRDKMVQKVCCFAVSDLADSVSPGANLALLQSW